MTDEEKKAIEYWKTHMEILHWNTQLASEHYIKVLLDLIEKQSKEIEHQKEKRENQKQELAILNAKQIEFNKLVNTVNSYKGQFKRQQKEIEELKAINKMQEYRINEMDIPKSVAEQRERKAYIKGTNDADELCNKKWEDKIKAKIQEVEQWELYNMKIPRLSTLDERLGAKIGIKYVLQSLLEKE